MSTQMQLRGGTTAENLLFTGAQREVSVDTDKNTLVVHDGVTPGGFTMASEAQVADSTYFYLDNTGGGSAANAYILIPQTNTNQPNSYVNGIVLGFVTANANTGASTANFQGLGVKNIKYPGGVDPAAGDVFGRVTFVYDATNDWLELQRKPTTPTSQIRALTAVVASNQLNISMNSTTINFRSATPSNGQVNTRTLTAPVTLTIPSGATLGTTSAAQSNIVVVAIDAAGTVELAVINLAGGVTLDETDLINTTAIGGASTGISTFYSQVTRNNVPYRVIGLIQSTQPTAGVWTATPSKVNGQGGQAIFDQKNRLFMGAAQNTTAGTSIDFTGIPSGANRVTLSLVSVSTSGTSIVTVQLGAGVAETTGYLGGRAQIVSGAVPAASTFTNGVAFDNTGAAASSIAGTIVFTRLASNTWSFIGSGALTNTVRLFNCAGSKTLGGTLDRVRLTTEGGTDTFDAGVANITWEL